MHKKKIRFIFGLVTAISLLIPFRSISLAQGVEGLPPLKIVQIGDSYSAGNGARGKWGFTNYEGVSGCYRSPTNWGSQFNESLSDTFAAQYINRACSGGVVDNITHERYMDEINRKSDGSCPLPKFPDEEEIRDTSDKEAERDPENKKCSRFLKPQINAINEETDLVLMTIGGNDLGFDSIVGQCFFTGMRDIATCKEVLTDANDDMDGLQLNLIKMFAEIRAKLRPDARIVLVSYPQLLLDVPYTLNEVKKTEPDYLDTYDAGTPVRALGITGEERQRAAVATANAAARDLYGVTDDYIVFYDGTKALFKGHEPDPSALGRNPNRWIHEFEDASIEAGQAEFYHPNPEGHENWGRALSIFETFGTGTGSFEKGADIDIVFVVDTTSSMGGEIAEVRANIASLVSQLDEKTESYRIAVVSYRDDPGRTGYSGDYPSKVIQEFTDDPVLIQTAINSLTLGYGGDWPETVFSGIQAAIKLDWRLGVTKIAMVIGDAPAISPEPSPSNLTAIQIIANSIAVDPVQVIGVDVGYLNYNGAVGQIAAGTGGSMVSGTSGLTTAISGILDRAAKQPSAWIGQAYSGKIGEPVQFDASGSYDPSGLLITLYEWDFDSDGVFDLQTTEPAATHVYDTAFDDYVVVRVTSPGGSALASARTVVNAQGYAPQGGEDSCELDENGFSIILDERGIFINCTADHLPEFDKEGVTEGSGNPLDNALANLEKAIDGLLPVAFENKYLVIKKEIEGEKLASACGSLQGMSELAKAQEGKKITQEQSGAVLEAVASLEGILGCSK